MKKMIMALAVVVLLAGLILGSKAVKPTEKTQGEGSASGSLQKEVKLSDFDVKDYVKLGNYMDAEVLVDYAEVTEEQVEEYANKLAVQYPDYKKIKKDTVAKGDVVNIDYKGLVKGKEFEGGTDTGFNLKIGGGGFIQGFEDGLIDAKTGDKLDLELTFPEDYQVAELAGKDVVFKVTVNSLMKEIIYTADQFTDTYVSECFGFDTVKEFMADVRSSLETENEGKKDSDTRAGIVDSVLETCEVKLPEGLLDYKVADYKKKYVKMVEDYGYQFKDFLQSTYQMTEKQFMDQITLTMEKSIKQEMVFSAIAEKEGIKIEEKAFAEYETSFLNYYGFKDKKELYKEYPKEDLERSYLCDQVVQKLMKELKIVYA